MAPKKAGKGGYAAASGSSAGAPGKASAGASTGSSERDKVAELSSKLSAFQGKALISIAVPAGDDLSQAVNWLQLEQNVAATLKNQEEKTTHLEAVALARDQLKKYLSTATGQCTATGLVVFCGQAIGGGKGGKAQQVSMSFEPFRPIKTSVLKRSTCFDTKALQELLKDSGSGNGKGEGKGLQGEQAAIIQKFKEEVDRDTGMACYGTRDTTRALQEVAVSTLIVHETLDLIRIRARGKKTGEEREYYITPEEDKGGKALKTCPKTGEKLERLETSSFAEWIRDHSWVFEVQLVMVPDSKDELCQYIKGMGGLGAMLHYKMNFDDE